jgi:hypothetical protein
MLTPQVFGYHSSANQEEKGMSKRSDTMFVRAGCAMLAVAITASAAAAPLIGAGSNLPIPSPNPGEPPREPSILTSVSGGFTGTWSAPALPDWIGTFSAVGPIPSSTANPDGITRYDFTSLPTGVLPTGTFFFFGDVDTGAGQTELFILSAADASGSLITTPWLDEPLGVSGSGTGGGGSILAGNTPGWDWNPALGEYTIDGTTVTGGNPTVAVWIENNTDIAFLEVERVSVFANFGLSAPIPEPATVTLLVLGGAIVARRRPRAAYCK